MRGGEGEEGRDGERKRGRDGGRKREEDGHLGTSKRVRD